MFSIENGQLVITHGENASSYEITPPASSSDTKGNALVVAKSSTVSVLTEQADIADYSAKDRIEKEGDEIKGWVTLSEDDLKLIAAEKDRIAKKKAADDASQSFPPCATPVDTSDVNNEKGATPNFYLVTAPAVGAAVSGTVAADMFLAQPMLENAVGAGAIAAGSVNAFLLTPALAGVLAYGFVYAGAKMQEALTGETMQDGVIHQNAKAAGEQLAACVFGVHAGQIIATMSGITSFGQENTDMLGAHLFEGISCLGSVEFKLGFMLLGGIGLGLGFMAMKAYQNRRDGVPNTASELATFFAVGFGIGMAASIGYGNEVAQILMPGAATMVGLWTLPTVQKGIEGTGALMNTAWNTAGEKIQEIRQHNNSAALPIS